MIVEPVIFVFILLAFERFLLVTHFLNRQNLLHYSNPSIDTRHYCHLYLRLPQIKIWLETTKVKNKNNVGW